jgi:undecaprenyl diphosphate synthase
MSMLKRYIRRDLKEVHKNNIKFQAIGHIEGLAADVQSEIAKAMLTTKDNDGMIMSVALNYGGRAEIVEACRLAVRELLKSGRGIEDLSEAVIERNLYTCGLPDLDLLIRTSGEFRISNFLLWQLAYSEIYVTPVLFPDFRRRQVFEAMLDYQKRDRRFGGVANDGGSSI